MSNTLHQLRLVDTLYHCRCRPAAATGAKRRAVQGPGRQPAKKPREARAPQEQVWVNRYIVACIREGAGGPWKCRLCLPGRQCPTPSAAAGAAQRQPAGLHCLIAAAPHRHRPCSAGAGKRDYVRWAPEEEAAFFEALRGVQGQKPEKCLKEIVARVGTKDYAQVSWTREGRSGQG